MATLPNLTAASPLDSSNNTYNTFSVDTDLAVINASFTDTPSDFQSADSITVSVEASLTGTVIDDVYTLRARITNGGTILAAADVGGTYQNITSSLTSTDNLYSLGFSYINTAATKADWDGASIQLQQGYLKSNGGDGLAIRMDYVYLTGTYTQAAASLSKTTTLAGLLQKTQSLQVQQNAALQKAFTFALNLDTPLGVQVISSVTLNSIMMKNILQTVQVETALQKSTALTINSSAAFAKTKLQLTNINSLLAQVSQLNVLTSAAIQKALQTSTVMESSLQKKQTTSLSTVGVIASRVTPTVLINSLLTSTLILQTSANAALSKIKTITLGMSASLSNIAERFKTTSLSSVLGLGLQIRQTTVSTALSKKGQKVVQQNVALQQEQTVNVDFAAAIGTKVSVPWMLDLAVYETYVKVLGSNSALQKQGLRPLEIGGTLQQTLYKEVGVQARIVFRYFMSVSAQGLLQKTAFTSLGITGYLKHVVACWQKPLAESTSWTAGGSKSTAWSSDESVTGNWTDEEVSPNGC